MPKNDKFLKIDINLLPKDPFFDSSVGKFFQWALSIGRYIVIFTELVVILCFIARFGLDRQVTDLNGKIHQKQLIIESYGSLEKDFRAVQKKIDDYSQIEKNLDLADTFPKFQYIVPNDITLTNLQITQNQISFEGVAGSGDALSTLISNLVLSSDFLDVKIDTIRSQEEKRPGFVFTASALTKVTQVQAVDEIELIEEESSGAGSMESSEETGEPAI